MKIRLNFIFILSSAAILFLSGCSASDNPEINSADSNSSSVNSSNDSSVSSSMNSSGDSSSSSSMNSSSYSSVSSSANSSNYSSIASSASFSSSSSSSAGTSSSAASSSSKSSSGSSSSSSAAITLQLDFTYGTTLSGSGNNVYTIWIENSDRSFIQNLYICTKLTNGTLTGTVLPYWHVNVLGKSDTTEVDAVTGATLARQNFTVTKQLKDPAKRQFKIYFETDQSWEVNDWFLKDQPSIVYCASVDLDSGVTSYTLNPIGWTVYEYTNIYYDGASQNANFTGYATSVGALETEMRYITNLKSGSTFGAADTTRSATLTVGNITLTIK